MKTFIAGLVIAIAITAIGWLGLDAAQISRVEANRDEVNVRLDDHSSEENADPSEEGSAMQR